MNYALIYGAFIASRKTREALPDGPIEVHHILPRSMGGDDSDANLVPLTAREHYFAHRLLAKIHGGKMNSALKIMSVRAGGGNKVSTSRGYSVAYSIPRRPRGPSVKKSLRRHPINPIKYISCVTLHAALKELGWSKLELARRLGLRPATVTDWRDNPPRYALAYLEAMLLLKKCGEYVR